MNTYHKFAPNVFVAKCTEKHEKGTTIQVTTKYGKENACIVHNFVGYAGTKESPLYCYSITREDGFNSQARAAAKAERLEGYAENAEKRSTAYYEASNEGRDFLALGEPIKIGHHSERRHRRLIERNWERMGKSVTESEKAKDYERRSAYWADRANKIDLSIPDSLAFFEFELEKAKKYHQLLKDKPEERPHGMSLQYANKAVKDLEDKVRTAIKLWGDEDDIKLMEQEKKEAAEAKLSKSTKKEGIVEKYFGFFAFNNEQFLEGYNKAKELGHIETDEKVVHVGVGLYVPKKYAKDFISEYRNN